MKHQVLILYCLLLHLPIFGQEGTLKATNDSSLYINKLYSYQLSLMNEWIVGHDLGDIVDFSRLNPDTIGAFVQIKRVPKTSNNKARKIMLSIIEGEIISGNGSKFKVTSNSRKLINGKTFLYSQFIWTNINGDKIRGYRYFRLNSKKELIILGGFVKHQNLEGYLIEYLESFKEKKCS